MIPVLYGVVIRSIGTSNAPPVCLSIQSLYRYAPWLIRSVQVCMWPANVVQHASRRRSIQISDDNPCPNRRKSALLREPCCTTTDEDIPPALFSKQTFNLCPAAGLTHKCDLLFGSPMYCGTRSLDGIYWRVAKGCQK